MSEVVITATGVVSPAGVGTEQLFRAMTAGETFFNNDSGKMRKAKATVLPWPVAAVHRGNIFWPSGSPWVDSKKYANVVAHAAITAALQTVEVTGRCEGADALRCGTVICIGTGGNEELGEIMSKLAVKAQTDPRPLVTLLYDEVPDYSYIRGIPSQIGQFVCMATGFLGSNVAVYGEGGAGGLGGLTLALRLIQSKELDRVTVVGVTPTLSMTMLAALDREDPLGTDASPGRGPFDVGRTGSFIGEGAAAIALERASVARSRGVAPLAELHACETACAPTRRDSVREAVGSVLEQTVLRPGLWWAHGSGSLSLDLEECQAVGPHVSAPTTSSKGTIGTSVECGGLIDVALAVEALRREVVPPVGLLDKPDPALGDIDFVVGKPRPASGVQGALVTSFTYGARASSAAAAMIRKARP